MLAATGRRPQLDRLELQNANLELDDRGAPLRYDDRTMQIAGTPIFLAGDINGERPLLHEAAAEGRIAGINAARYPDVRAHVRYVPLAIMFSNPNVALVGVCPGPEGEGEAWDFGEVEFRNQGRARVIGENHGRARIYADRSCGEILGAELIGPRVEHLAHLLTWAIEQRRTVPQALAMPYYHPVVEEGLRTALQQLGRKIKMAPKPREELASTSSDARAGPVLGRTRTVWRGDLCAAGRLVATSQPNRLSCGCCRRSTRTASSSRPVNRRLGIPGPGCFNVLAQVGLGLRLRPPPRSHQPLPGQLELDFAA